MRAAIVTGAFPPSPEPVATTVKHLVDEAVVRGHEPVVLAPGAGPGPASYRGVPVVRARDQVGAALTAHRPDVVHVADPRLVGPGAARAAQRLGVPVVVSHHSVGSGPLSDWWGSWWASGATLSLATCLLVEETLRSIGEPTALWRPGVDLDLATPGMRTEALRSRWGRGDRLVVGHVGPVDKPNVRRRLTALAALPGVRLVALRAGIDSGRLRAKAPGATVVPELSGVDLAHALASCDLLVHARRKDLDCHAARKALACGVPVVGYAAGGLGDVVADDVNGVLVDPVRGATLAGAVAELRDDRPRVRRLAARARDAVTGRTWADAYDELVEVHYAAALLRARAATG